MMELLTIIETGVRVGFFIAAVIAPVGLVIILLDKLSRRGEKE
jgi:hypothetical protein